MKEVLKPSAKNRATTSCVPQLKKILISSIIFFVLAGLTFYTIFHGNNMSQVMTVAKGMNHLYLLLAIGCAIAFVCGEGFMIWYLLHEMDSSTRLLKCIGYSFIGFFYSGITPSATGGQPMQLYYMKKDGHKLSESTVVLMTVAILYKFVLVLIGVGMLLFWRAPLMKYLGQYYMLLYYVGLSLNVILVVILLFVMFRPVLFQKVLLAGEGVLVKLHLMKPSEKRRESVYGFVESYQETLGFLQQNKKKIVIATLITVLQRSMLFVLTWFVYRGFGLTGNHMTTVIALQAAVYVAVDMLPLPGAQGISELMYHQVFTGIFTGNLLTASLCITRGLNFYFLLIVSAVISLGAWIIGLYKRKYFHYKIG